ncbi:hypothetical protein QN219_14150 [Sinorhizobium sp. 7-81]|uniref:hypothetical protein n=1 Tax=Sinorhizobium sp. 8-89 TaxID=3049089 RepID=UPI0024C240C9|nr:hypothetical protein [Sinorhizobium sp. 8-89]MDK1491197.1 hypothetical protein [Sinorhizobium sp. 8-89]
MSTTGTPIARRRRVVRFVIAHPAILLGASIGVAEWALQHETENVGDCARCDGLFDAVEV